MSRVLVGAAATALGLAAALATIPGGARDVAAALRRSLLRAAQDGGADPLPLAVEALSRAAHLSLGPAAAACAGAILAGVAQSGGLFAPGALRPQASRLSPWTGLRRMLGPPAIGRAAFALAAGIGAVGAAAASLAAQAPVLARLPRLHAVAAFDGAVSVVASAAVGLAAILAVAAAGDVLLVRHRHLRRLRMTRAEMERDLREDEGDPHLRSERRRLHASLSRQGARAACVVVNPTRLAVALAHRRDADDPPHVLAKASGARAATLRREARRVGIPVVHDRPLARALFRLADVGEPIPEELYEATAAVLAHLDAAAARGAGLARGAGGDP